MIIDLLGNAEKYYKIHPRLKQAFEYLKKTDYSGFAPGKFEIDGLNLFGLMSEYETTSKEQAVWEAHRKYIDIQFMIEGEEFLGYAPISTLKVSQEYQAEKDCLFLAGEGSYFVLTPGMFVVFYPEDSHQTGLSINMPKRVKKGVLKVGIN